MVARRSPATFQQSQITFPQHTVTYERQVLEHLFAGFVFHEIHTGNDPSYVGQEACFHFEFVSALRLVTLQV